MSRQLRSWLVRVRDREHTRGRDGWGDETSWRAIRSHYVVARSRVDAISQAKRMAGYTTLEERRSAAGVVHAEVLSDLV